MTRFGAVVAPVARCALLAVSLAAVIDAPAVCADPASPGSDARFGDTRRVAVSVGSLFRSVDVETAGDSTISIRQAFLPIAINVPIGERFDFVMTTGAGRSALELSGDEDNLSGFADTKFKGSVRMGDRFLLSAGAAIPTGTARLTSEEARVARAVSLTLLGFHTRNLGEGRDVDVGAAFAAPLGEVSSLALGASYLKKGGYTLLEEIDAEYEPGDELTLSAGVDHAAERVFLRADATYRSFGVDQFGDAEVFEQGDRVELDQLLAAAVAGTRLTIRAREAIAGDDRVSDPSVEATGLSADGPGHVWAEVEVARSVSAGNRPAQGPGGTRIDLSARVSHVRFGPSDLELGDGHLTGFGGGVRYPISRSLTIHLGGEVLTGEGRIGESVAKSDLSGYQLSAGVVIRRGVED